MTVALAARQLIRNEAQALITRLDRMEPFSVRTPMVLAAAIPLEAQVAIEKHLSSRRRSLRLMVSAFVRWLDSSEGKRTELPLVQRRFSILRLRFIAILAQLDIFAVVQNQRSEHESGIWLSGLDAFAADALKLPGRYYDPPPLVCFLERSAGAAIRRVRTRLPGGDDNPVGVIQIPRERMIGSGIASSLVHEVGHQGAALLDLVTPLQLELKKRADAAGEEKIAWQCWGRWISEIVSDFWAVARLGISASVGLMTVVSLPRPFVFRIDLEDPHPAPWIRVRLSCAMGAVLYPHPQWELLSRAWEEFYPRKGLDPEKQRIFAVLEKTLVPFARFLLDYRPQKLRGKSLREAVASQDRQPARLAALYRSWKKSPELIRRASPTLVFAAVGQAKADGVLDPEEESRVLAEQLRYWALKLTLDSNELCTAKLRKQPPFVQGMKL